MLLNKVLKSHGGGISSKLWVEMCSTLLETLILCQTKILDFPYPISDLIQNFIPYFREGLHIPDIDQSALLKR